MNLRSGELVNRLSSDTTVISKTLTGNLASTLRMAIEGIGGVAILLYLAPKLTLLMLSVIPPVGIGAVIFGRYMKKFAQKTQDELAVASSVATERFNNIRTVKSFAQEEREIKHYDSKINNVFDLGKQMSYMTASFVSVVHTAGNFSVLAVLGYGGHLVLKGAMTVGDLTSFMLYSVYVLFSTTSVSNFYADIMKTLGVADKIYQYLDNAPKINNASTSLQEIKGDVSFKNISFSYPTRPDSLIFDNLNLSVPNGKVIALVGPSGSGKSTVIFLVLFF